VLGSVVCPVSGAPGGLACGRAVRKPAVSGMAALERPGQKPAVFARLNCSATFKALWTLSSGDVLTLASSDGRRSGHRMQFK
jgi:hypothetical protein